MVNFDIGTTVPCHLNTLENEKLAQLIKETAKKVNRAIEEQINKQYKNQQKDGTVTNYGNCTHFEPTDKNISGLLL